MDISGVAVFSQPLVPVSGELCFQAVGGIVESCVKDTAVSRAGVEAAVSFFFDQNDTGVGKAVFDLAGDADPDDPAANN